MYKALFELSSDRADFVGESAVAPASPGLTAKSSAVEIFGAFSAVDPSEPMLNATLAAIRNQLSRSTSFDCRRRLARIEEIYRVFICRPEH